MQKQRRICKHDSGRMKMKRTQMTYRNNGEEVLGGESLGTGQRHLAKR